MSYTAEISSSVKNIYDNLEHTQSNWYRKTNFNCPEGCGCCCHNFEPELFESEAIFMADWLIENRPEAAMQLADGNFRKDYAEKTCIFFREDSNYHCTIYGGRPFICRLFGASSSYDKNGNPVWKPCKFYPAEELAKHIPPITHIQYTKAETEKVIGMCPPPMSDFMEGAVSLTPGNSGTFPLRKILPETIRKILFERQMKKN